MTILTLREGPGAKSLVKCDNPNCGLEYEVLTCTCKKSKLHYCDSECRFGKPSKYSDPEYREEKRIERYDARLLKEDEVKKRCIRCGRIYEGPPGEFTKSRDKSKPEPGQCGCINRAKYREEDYHEQEHVGIVNG